MKVAANLAVFCLFLYITYSVILFIFGECVKRKRAPVTVGSVKCTTLFKMKKNCLMRMVCKNLPYSLRP